MASVLSIYRPAPSGLPGTPDKKFLMASPDGIGLQPFQNAAPTEQTYMWGSVIRSKWVEQPNVVSGSVSGRLDPGGLGLVLNSMLGMVTPTGSVAPFTWVWNSVASKPLKLCMEDVWKDGDDALFKLYDLLITSIQLQMNAREQLITTLNFIAVKEDYSGSNPTGVLWDDADLLAVQDSGPRKSIGTCVVSAVTGKMEDISDTASFTITRNASSGNPAWSKGLQPPSANSDKFAKTTFNFNATHGYEDKVDPLKTFLSWARGGDGNSIPTTRGESKIGAVTVKHYGGLITGTDYFSLQIAGNYKVSIPSYDKASTVGAINFLESQFPTITLVNEDGEYPEGEEPA